MKVNDALEDIQPNALLVLGEDTLIDFGIDRSTILRYAVEHRIPGMYLWRKWPAEVGLMSCGPGGGELYRRAALYVDEILRGSRRTNFRSNNPHRANLSSMNWCSRRELQRVAAPVQTADVLVDQAE